MPVGIYNLWANEAARGGACGRDGLPPAWLPVEHRARWERLRQARLLFTGKHRQYFLDEQRTEFDFPNAITSSGTIQPYSTLNLLRLISVKTADLLFGSKARINAPTPEQTDAIDELARRSMLHSRLHAAVVAASWAGGSFLESVIWKDEPYIQNVAPDELYPIGLMGPDGQYERYIRFAIDTIGTAEASITLLLKSEYQPGRIVRRLYQLQGNGKPTELTLDQWPTFTRSGVVPLNDERTGLADNTITYVANEVGGETELSDYDGLISFQDTVNAKYTQVNRVIAQHTDPAMAFPANAFDEQGQIQASHKAFAFRSKEEIPQYIVWQAQLEAAMQDRTAAINALCMAAEMSQVLLGLKDGAAPDAARKLRLEATNTLAKVGRKALMIEPVIARAIEVTQRLDQTTRLRRSYPIDPIGVEPRDGLPVDEVDEANAISMYRSAGVMSVEAGVERRIEDPDAVAAELERLAAEKAAAMPSVFMSNTGAEMGQEPGNTDPANDPAKDTANVEGAVAA